MDDLKCKILSENDLNFVLQKLEEAALWLQEKKIDYWQNWLKPPAKHVQWIKEGLCKGEFRVITHSRLFIALYRIQNQDLLFWGPQHDKACYIHSFTVNRQLAAKGWGYCILDRIQAEARKNGSEYLRLDCGYNVDKLCNYYTDYGFNAIKRINIDGHDLLLFQKKISIPSGS